MSYDGRLSQYSNWNRPGRLLWVSGFAAVYTAFEVSTICGLKEDVSGVGFTRLVGVDQKNRKQIPSPQVRGDRGAVIFKPDPPVK